MGLHALLAQGAAPAAWRQVLSVQLRDVSEPLPLALPRYAGEIYIYAALIMGGVWMLSTVPLLAAYALVFVSAARVAGALAAWAAPLLLRVFDAHSHGARGRWGATPSPPPNELSARSFTQKTFKAGNGSETSK